jgi:monoamine oxidase
MSLGDWIARLKCSALTKRALAFQNANTNGAEAGQQSYLANLALIAGGALHGEPADFLTLSENVRCAKGNDRLAWELADHIGRLRGEVKRGAPIVEIAIEPDKVTVTPAKGKPVSADAVVLAVPPSVWKDIKVTPTLSSDFSMAMGSAVKYLSRAESRFWIRKGKAPSATFEGVGVTWEGTDNQMQAPGQGVELTLFAGGRAAEVALSIFRERGREALRDHYDARLGRLFGNYRASRAPDPDFRAWPFESRIETGYSCPAPGQVTTVAPKLNRPFHKRLYFAGEHVCIPFFGYMEGALQSGVRAAKAIIRAYG